jgi:uncharacterized SAM-binding protein YcdF (DUF218 family)
MRIAAAGTPPGGGVSVGRVRHPPRPPLSRVWRGRSPGRERFEPRSATSRQRHRRDRAAPRRSAETIPATAGAARSTRSATGAEPARPDRVTVVHRPSLAGDLARLALVSAVGLSGLAAYAVVRIWQEGSRDERPSRVDAVVVLGASQEHGYPRAVLRARLDHAVALYKTGLARFFVVTGGVAEGDRLSEGEVARRYALERGVPDAAILAETAGHDTLSSLRGVRDIFTARGLQSGLFVSDSTHLFRVLRMARDLGLTAFGSPATGSPIDRDPIALALAVGHELLALADYLLLAS